MKYSMAKQGRVFIMRLEDGEILHEVIEQFAAEQDIAAAALVILGGAHTGSRLVVGPEDGDSRPVHPMEQMLDNVHEIAGVGTIFPDESGNPVLHAHIASGRLASTVTGCVRRGVRVWQVAEVILFELRETRAVRIPDPELGFSLLSP